MSLPARTLPLTPVYVGAAMMPLDTSPRARRRSAAESTGSAAAGAGVGAASMLAMKSGARVGSGGGAGAGAGAGGAGAGAGAPKRPPSSSSSSLESNNPFFIGARARWVMPACYPLRKTMLVSSLCVCVRLSHLSACAKTSSNSR